MLGAERNAVPMLLMGCRWHIDLMALNNMSKGDKLDFDLRSIGATISECARYSERDSLPVFV